MPRRSLFHALALLLALAAGLFVFPRVSPAQSAESKSTTNIMTVTVNYVSILNFDLFYKLKKSKTIIVSAEGLADPNADTYKRDKGLMIDDLRRDAKRQAIEKAVGTFVESSTLVENYMLVQDRILTKSEGFIKQIVKETEPTLGEDGFMHLLIKAEVVLSDVKAALDSMSKTNRLQLIKEAGNPTISVAILVRDAARDTDLPPEKSTIAENLLKEHFKNFGYRVWSEDYTKLLQREAAGKATDRRVADFSVLGEVKFKSQSALLAASKLKVTTFSLTSWTVKCIDNHTGEEIYFNNQVPKKKTWTSEDEALKDIGELVGGEFNKGFCDSHLMQPSRIFQLQMLGLPDYDTGLLFKKEFIGLRPVLNADLKSFDASGLSLYEIEFAGSSGNFAQIVNDTIINPLNQKLGQKTFKLLSHHGDVLKIQADLAGDAAQVQAKIKSLPPASLADATPERLREIVKSDKAMDKVKQMNPGVVQALDKKSVPAHDAKNQSLQNF